MEEKLNVINNILTEIKEEEKKKREAENKKKENEIKEWRKKLRKKEEKEKEETKRRTLEIQRKVGDRWATQKWVTNFIADNSDTWDKEKIEKEKEINKELEEWEKYKRFEKIKHLRRRWESRCAHKKPEIVTDSIQEDFPEDDVFQNISDKILSDARSEHEISTKTSSGTHVPGNDSNQDDSHNNDVFQTIPTIALDDERSNHPILADAISEHEVNIDIKTSDVVQTLPTNVLSDTTFEHPVVDDIVSSKHINKKMTKLRPPTSKDNPKLPRKKKEMSSVNKLNINKITDAFRRQPQSGQKTTPSKVNMISRTSTDVHINSDVMHQNSALIDSTKSHSTSTQISHKVLPDLAPTTSKANPNNLMLSLGDQMNQMSGDQNNAIILSCKNLLEKDTSLVLKTFAVKKK